KDLIVVRGRSIHPQDEETAAQESDRRRRPGRGVAFPVRTADGEGVALMQETTARQPEQLRSLAGAASRSVLERQQVALSVVYLVAPRSVRRTSSGKLRRRA